MSPLQPWWHPAHSQASCPCPQPLLPACSPGQGSICGPSSASAFHANGKRGFLRPLLSSLPLSQHAGCSHKGGSICVVWREAAFGRLHRPTPFQPLPSFHSCAWWRSKTSQQAWLIFRRLHSQRHPFTSQSKRTPNGPDLSLQGPMSGPWMEQSVGWKQGRKEGICVCLLGRLPLPGA